jgi:hypothetical protein
MEYEYKVIPFIGHSRGVLSATEVALQLEVIINEHASRGWEFHQMSDVNIEVQPGCLSGLFGGRVQYVRFDQLIFKAAQHIDRFAVHNVQREDELDLSGENTTHVVREALPEETRTRPPLPPALKHLEVWRRKSDGELIAAAASANDYTAEARTVILEELTWRKLEIDAEKENDTRADSFCYHCGADVSAGTTTCTACGKPL